MLLWLPFIVTACAGLVAGVVLLLRFVVVAVRVRCHDPLTKRAVKKLARDAVKAGIPRYAVFRGLHGVTIRFDGPPGLVTWTGGAYRARYSATRKRITVRADLPLGEQRRLALWEAAMRGIGSYWKACKGLPIKERKKLFTDRGLL